MNEYELRYYTNVKFDEIFNSYSMYLGTTLGGIVCNKQKMLLCVRLMSSFLCY